MLRCRAALLLICLVASPAASEEAAESETVWLRGRGSDVWIERGGEARISRDGERTGLTRVESPPPVAAGPGNAVRQRAPTPVVVLSAPSWSYDAVPYEHAYSPRFYYPRYSFRLHPDHHRHRLHRAHRFDRHRGDRHRHPGFGRSFHPGFRGHGAGHRLHRGHGGHRFAPQGHAQPHDGGAYRNAGPYGGQVRSGGHVLRGGAYRRTR